ncbi:TIGR03086 family metal-binding protein [Dactylosporangium sp. CS-047395]|uniref:TIGR03086 family metal-binding protein n=1 Tax=Dactylosporangium sp. CS-047395 TaxID=3239936 RepID=UPI003D8F0DBB
MDDELLSIGALARRTGLPVKLVRHWSDLGIVPAAGRTGAGYRRFEPRAVARLEFARTLRQLGLGMDAIRGVVTREDTLGEVAAAHARAIDAQIRALKLQQAVLRSVAARGSSAEELGVLTRLARLSAAERAAIIERFVAETVGDVDVPAYRDGLLAARPDLPDDPTAEQVDAWLELAELVADPELGRAMRRTAEYVARIAPGAADDGSAERVTAFWVARVGAAMRAGIAADSPSADPIVAEIVQAWLPTQRDTTDPRAQLLEQLEVAADAKAERYWQLVCVITGRPVPPSLAGPGQWLMTALRANPSPGARAAAIAAQLDRPPPDSLLESCEQVLHEVGALVASTGPERLADPTPCGGWDVRALLDHMVYENLLWTSLAENRPRSDFAADHLDGDHVAAFRAAAAATMRAFRRPGMLEAPYGPARGWNLVEQLVIEMLAHGWDLATATGRSTDLAPDVALAVLPAVHRQYASLPRTPGGSFGPERPAPPGATPADRLAAYLGRG